MSLLGQSEEGMECQIKFNQTTVRNKGGKTGFVSYPRLVSSSLAPHLSPPPPCDPSFTLLLRLVICSAPSRLVLPLLDSAFAPLASTCVLAPLLCSSPLLTRPLSRSSRLVSPDASILQLVFASHGSFFALRTPHIALH